MGSGVDVRVRVGVIVLDVADGVTVTLGVRVVVAVCVIVGDRVAVGVTVESNGV